MKTLDALLYQWVGETDESRMDSAFRAYYSAAFPSLVRHVQHRTGWDRASAEDIAQEALLRFLERAGRGRREAGALVRTSLMRLNSVQVAVLDSCRVARWAGDVDAFADSVIHFHLPSRDGFADAERMAAIGGLSAQIMPLQRRGWCLLDEARRNLQRLLHENFGSPEACAIPTGEDVGADLHESETARFARELVRHAAPSASPAAAAEERCPGVGRLMESVLTVVETLPRLRVPSNGFLFEIATTTLLDEIKRRRRRKRGGLDDGAAGHEALGCRMPGVSAHPIKAMPDDPHAEPDDDGWLNRGPTLEQHWHVPTGMLPFTIDPVTRYESEDLLERFYEYLRRPVAQAVHALEEALARGRAIPEQRRLECVGQKFSRTMAVLAMIGEGYTQEEAARCVGLSRNQVKYIVESIKELYARFTADVPREPEPSVDRKGESDAS